MAWGWARRDLHLARSLEGMPETRRAFSEGELSESAVQNLVLLCRRHHRMVHARGGFRLGLEEGRPVFRRPDGEVLEERAPP